MLQLPIRRFKSIIELEEEEQFRHNAGACCRTMWTRTARARLGNMNWRPNSLLLVTERIPSSLRNLTLPLADLGPRNSVRQLASDRHARPLLRSGLDIAASCRTGMGPTFLTKIDVPSRWLAEVTLELVLLETLSVRKSHARVMHVVLVLTPAYNTESVKQDRKST